MGSALLVAPGASVARYSSYPVFARALSGALVARLARGTYGVAVAGCNTPCANNGVSIFWYYHYYYYYYSPITYGITQSGQSNIKSHGLGLGGGITNELLLQSPRLATDSLKRIL